MLCPNEKDKNLNWSYGLPGNRLSEALKSWTIDELPGNLYRMQNADTEDLKLILKSLNTELPLKLFTRGDLRTLKSSIHVF